jgi:hypothetical protein
MIGLHGEMWGKPFLEISDDDIATATRAYRSCIARSNVSLAAIAEAAHIGRATPVQPSPQFESALRNSVMAARNLDNQKKAQQAASGELEKEQAQRRLDRAEEEARAKQEQLRERAQRDRETAEEARRLAELEELKIAEAAKEAEEAQRARREAEQRLAEIRSRIDAQQKARNEAIAMAQAAEDARKLELQREASRSVPSEATTLPTAGERDKTIGSTGVLDLFDDYKKQHPPGDTEVGLAAMLTYNAICEGITPKASSKMLEAYGMMAMLLGVDINDPATKTRVADIGKVMIVGYNLGLGGPGNSKVARCKQTYSAVADMEKTISGTAEGR